MNRAWAVGVSLAVLIGLTVLVVARPTATPLRPEDRAMRQLEDASIRPTQVRYLRVSPREPSVVCGLLIVEDPRSQAGEARFVSTPERIVVGRADNPTVQTAVDRHCHGVFTPPLAPVPD